MNCNTTAVGLELVREIDCTIMFVRRDRGRSVSDWGCKTLNWGRNTLNNVSVTLLHFVRPATEFARSRRRRRRERAKLVKEFHSRMPVRVSGGSMARKGVNRSKEWRRIMSKRPWSTMSHGGVGLHPLALNYYDTRLA